MTAFSFTDLGLCNAFTEGEQRCPGRLLVECELGGLLEARCDVCGAEAARPTKARESEPVDDHPDRWWDRP